MPPMLRSKGFSTALAVVAVAVSIGACGDDTLLTPETGSLPPLVFTATLSHTGTGDGLDFPRTVPGHLYLDIGPSGLVEGSISTIRSDFGTCETLASPVGQTEGQVVGQRIVLESGYTSACPGGDISWEEVSLTLHDDNGDGQPDTVHGTMSGEWSVGYGDDREATQIAGTIVGGPDIVGPEVRLAYLNNYGEVADSVLPIDPIRVTFSEVVPAESLDTELQLLADGEPLPGSFLYAPSNDAGTMVRSTSFMSDVPIPFDSEITVRINGFTDMAGNGAFDSGFALQTAADPGPLAPVPTFDDVLTGWIHQGGVDTAAEYLGITPATGTTLGRMSEESRLFGYFDVTEPVTPFEISATLFKESGDIESYLGAVLRVHTAVWQIDELYNAADHLELEAPCADCDGFATQLGPVSTLVDLSEYVGQRVFLVFEVNTRFTDGRRALVIDSLPVPEP